jgi:hypothetical protein
MTQHLSVVAGVVVKRDEAGHRRSEREQPLGSAAIFLALGGGEVPHPESEQADYVR